MKWLISILLFILMLNFVSATYAPPTYDNVTIVLKSSYIIPTYDNVTIILGEEIPSIDYSVVLPLGFIRFLNCSPDFENPVSIPEGQGVSTNLCYQETANSSSIYDGECGLNYSGLYLPSGDWSSVNKVLKTYDTNFETFGTPTTEQTSSIIINYSKPSESIGAIWRIKITDDENYTIPSDCFEKYDDILELKVDLDSSISSGDIYCFNGTWNLLHNFASYALYEEGIYWNVSQIKNSINAKNIGSGSANLQIRINATAATGWTLFASNQSDLSQNLTLSTSWQTIYASVNDQLYKQIWLFANCSFINSNARTSIEMRAV